jgi:signal transduction histidine kinase
MPDLKKIKRHSFEPGAMSIIQMGEELIGHPTTAINELVKNGYDADATNVYVYVYIGDEKNFIAIYDDGLGMLNSTLFGDWLKPSISSKRSPGVKSEVFERSFLGSKGIGRLAAMALGKIVTVITKRIDEKEYNWLTLNSTAFKTDQLLSEIKFPGDTISKYSELFIDRDYLKLRETVINEELIKFISDKSFKDFKEGTLIIIEDVDESVKTIFQAEFKQQNEMEDSVTLPDTSVYRGLSVLITPLKLNGEIQKELLKEKIINKTTTIAIEDNTFQIQFGTNLIPSEEKIEFINVKPTPIINLYDYRILGKVTKTGDVVGKFICKRLKDFEFFEDFNISHEVVFEKSLNSSDKTKRKNKELTEAEWNASTGEFYFDIRVYDRGEEDSREKLFKLIQGNTTEQKRKIIDNLLGLRISKNGFGVKPYGDEVKDWLDLSQIRVQNPGQNVSVNQILGYVFFYSPENDGLKEKTNREGFYENKAFKDVRIILEAIFRVLGQVRYNFRLRHNLGRIPRNRLQRPDTKKFIDYIKESTGDKNILKKSEEFVKEITTALDSIEDTLSFSQRLASLGTGLELVYHELAQPIAKIGGSRALLSRNATKIKDQPVRDFFIKEITQIGSFVAELDELKSSLKPAIGKSKPQIFKPNHTFKKVCYLFRSDFAEENIDLFVQKESEKYEIDEYEYPLWISFLNIVNNAVYWLKLNKDKEKKISFSIERKNHIVITNNGPFIPEDYIDLIFEYGFTLKKEKSATGLGLAFTKNILNLNNWEITAENREKGPAFIIKKIKNE